MSQHNKISIELSPHGVKMSIDALNRYKARCHRKIDELMEELAKIGLREATIRFQLGAFNGNEMPNRLEIEKIENGFKIVAEGHDVYFIEFGTGDAAGEHPDEDKSSVPVYPGSWSERHAQEYSTTGEWIYRGYTYHETPAEMPIYHSAREIERNVRKIAREVFSRP